jgi:hypothetical protein
MAMSFGGEPNGVSASLESLLPDPLAFVERVFQHVQDQLMRDDRSIDDGYKPADEWLAAVLGSKLARLIGKEDVSVGEEWSLDFDRNEKLAHWKELAARDAVLAAALGACECWGMCAECPSCGGDGTPGWALPDEQLYASYVNPAVSAITKVRGFGNAGTENYGKETANV